jgi:hypothetical protein
VIGRCNYGTAASHVAAFSSPLLSFFVVALLLSQRCRESAGYYTPLGRSSVCRTRRRLDLQFDFDAGAEAVDDADQAIQGEPSKIGVADAGRYSFVLGTRVPPPAQPSPK